MKIVSLAVVVCTSLISHCLAQSSGSSVDVVGADLISLTTRSHSAYSYTYQFLATIEFKIDQPGEAWFSIPTELSNSFGNSDDSQHAISDFDFGHIEQTEKYFKVSFTSVPSCGYHNLTFPVSFTSLDTVYPDSKNFTFVSARDRYNVTIDFQRLPTDRPVVNAKLNTSNKTIKYFLNIPSEIFYDFLNVESSGQYDYIFDRNSVGIKYVVLSSDPFNDPAGTGNYDEAETSYINDSTTPTRLNITYNGGLSTDYTNGTSKTIYTAIVVEFTVKYTELQDIYTMNVDLILRGGTNAENETISYFLTAYVYAPKFLTVDQACSASSSETSGSSDEIFTSASCTAEFVCNNTFMSSSIANITSESVATEVTDKWTSSSLLRTDDLETGAITTSKSAATELSTETSLAGKTSSPTPGTFQTPTTNISTLSTHTYSDNAARFAKYSYFGVFAAVFMFL